MTRSRNNYWLGVLLASALATGFYFTLRYGGTWAEGDSGVLSIAIAGVQHTGRLIFPRAYAHGLGYPAWAAALGELSGLPISAVQQVLMPLLGNLLAAVLGLAAFRRLLRSEWLGMLAAGLLFTNSYFVFVVSRGSHERIDVTALLMGVLALMKLLERSTARWNFSWSMVFLLSTGGLVLSNDFFALMFIAMLAFTVLVFALVARLGVTFPPHILRPSSIARDLAVAATIGLILWLGGYVLYPPALVDSQLIIAVFDHIRAFLMTFKLPAHPYAAAASNYADQLLYVLSSVPRWLLFLSSFVVFVLEAIAIMRVRKAHPTRVFLLAFYVGYGLLLVFAIPIDFLGLSSGSNVEVRLFTDFVLFSTPLMAVALAYSPQWAQHIPLTSRLGAVLALGGFLAVYVTLNWMAATSDPQLSNNWIFYKPPEVQAARFYMAHQQYGNLWIGANPNRRMWSAYAMNYPETLVAPSNLLSTARDYGGLTDALISPIVSAEAVRYRIPLPPVTLGDRVYDNGFAQLYHRFPITPFQR